MFEKIKKLFKKEPPLPRIEERPVIKINRIDCQPLKAMCAIDDFRLKEMEKSGIDIDDYVRNKLAYQFMEIIKEKMTVNEVTDYGFDFEYNGEPLHKFASVIYIGFGEKDW